MGIYEEKYIGLGDNKPRRALKPMVYIAHREKADLVLSQIEQLRKCSE